jgi:hypothetical protein
VEDRGWKVEDIQEWKMENRRLKTKSRRLRVDDVGWRMG